MPMDDVWLRWSVDAHDRQLARPLAVAVAEDAMRESRIPARPRRDPRLPGHVGPLLDEAARRVELDLGEPLAEGLVPFRGETLESFLCAHLQPGPCPDLRPVDAASMCPLPAGDHVV